MIYLGNGLYYNNSISHHGIKGQRWGVRNGPPYPLDYTTKRDKGLGRRYGMSQYLSAADNGYEESYNYTNNGKKYFMTPSAAVKAIINEGSENYITIPGRKIGGNYEWNYNDSGINDMYEAGQSNNCTKCASTAMLRKRGYDVQPGRSAFGAADGATEYWWDGAESHKDLSMESAYSLLNDMPIGAAGCISGMWENGEGGHMFNWERTSEGVNFVDLQPRDGEKSTNLSQVFSSQHFDKRKGCNVYRLDQATPNWDHMAEDGVFRIAKDGHSSIYDRQNDTFSKGIDFDIESFSDGTRRTRTTFKNCFNEWEHGYVSKKWGEQARGYDQ